MKGIDMIGGGRKAVSRLVPVAAIVGAAVLPVAASAAEGGCISLKTVAEVEQTFKNEKGETATKLVPAAKVVPGGEVVWTVTASNVCNKPADKVSIDNPVPEHMTYVADSAIGPGTDVQFSLDGKSFAAADALSVRDADGKSRPARADEYAAIRWTFKNTLAPGAVAFARFRATVK